jgi:hypothetical protein
MTAGSPENQTAPLPDHYRSDPQQQHVCFLWLYHSLGPVHLEGRDTQLRGVATHSIPRSAASVPSDPDSSGNETVHPGRQDITRSTVLWTLWADGRRRLILGYGSSGPARDGQVVAVGTTA